VSYAVAEEYRKCNRISDRCGQATSFRKMPCLLFVFFSLLASKKSSDTRKYHLLIKRNPLYFLGAFFHLLGKLGLLSTKVLYFGKVENINFSFTRFLRC